MNEEPQRPPRRKRYSGKNPRRFEDKYKEHDSTCHADTIAKVLAAGKTPAGTHVPIMTAECLGALCVKPGDRGVDATLGYGGHAAAILERISPGGMLLGLDQDIHELPKTETRLRERWADQFLAVRSNFAGIRKAMASCGWADVDFVFADLGCSSMQYDDPRRGFTFKHEGPLDMRMNPSRGITARELLRKLTPRRFAEILQENSDEPQAQSLADQLAGKDFPTTARLAEEIRKIAGGENDQVTLKRVFQALRIEVNDEFGALDALLRTLPGVLKAGGRVAILTFHSGEDRRVKKAFQRGLSEGEYGEISREVIISGMEERRANPRSAPAKLRWAQRGGSNRVADS